MPDLPEITEDYAEAIWDAIQDHAELQGHEFDDSREAVIRACVSIVVTMKRIQRFDDEPSISQEDAALLHKIMAALGYRSDKWN